MDSNPQLNDIISDQNIDQVWKDAWDRVKTAHVASTGQESALWRHAKGRATKSNPDGENEAWWYVAGRGMVKSWVDFRLGSNGWTLWSIGDQPAIELVLNPIFKDVPVKMAIDRIMVTPDGELVIVDLKTGNNTPDPLQLAFYAAGMEKMFGIRPRYGTYWMARKGTTGSLIDLDHITTDMVEDLVVQFDNARKAGIFLPNLGACGYCSYTSQCKWKAKDTQ